jgi:RNA polymerase sigma factor (sigma-70 family)
MSGSEPARDLLQRWRSGDPSAAEALYLRYAERLWTLAEREIGDRLRRRVGADDVLQSVFGTFFRRTAEGQFSIQDSGSLWRLLAQITLNKVRRQAEFHGAGRRSIRAEVHLDDGQLSPELFARAPTREDVNALLGELETLVAELDPSDTDVVRLAAEGYTVGEIGTKVGCSRWTVRRVLNRVRDHLTDRMKAD